MKKDAHRAEASSQDAGRVARHCEKKAYSQPTLVRFGQVAALTQNGTAFCHDDSGTCVVSATMSGRISGSDRRIKENIRRVGDHPMGVGLYLFDYKPEYRGRWGHGRQFGVMADEVERVMPQAVTEHADGYKMVCYDTIGISRAD
jgi:hypothetical protein